MKVSNFKAIIREAVREELRESLPELLKEQAGLESKKPPAKRSDFMEGISHAMNLQDQAKKSRVKDNKKYSNSPSLLEIAKVCNDHFNLLINNRGQSIGMNLMRKHLSNYLKGFPGAANYRQKLVTAGTFEIMKNGLIEFEKFATGTNK